MIFTPCFTVDIMFCCWNIILFPKTAFLTCGKKISLYSHLLKEYIPIACWIMHRFWQMWGAWQCASWLAMFSSISSHTHHSHSVITLYWTSDQWHEWPVNICHYQVVFGGWPLLGTKTIIGHILQLHTIRLMMDWWRSQSFWWLFC